MGQSVPIGGGERVDEHGGIGPEGVGERGERVGEALTTVEAMGDLVEHRRQHRRRVPGGLDHAGRRRGAGPHRDDDQLDEVGQLVERARSRAAGGAAAGQHRRHRHVALPRIRRRIHHQPAPFAAPPSSTAPAPAGVPSAWRTGDDVVSSTASNAPGRRVITVADMRACALCDACSASSAARWRRAARRTVDRLGRRTAVTCTRAQHHQHEIEVWRRLLDGVERVDRRCAAVEREERRIERRRHRRRRRHGAEGVSQRRPTADRPGEPVAPRRELDRVGACGDGTTGCARRGARPARRWRGCIERARQRPGLQRGAEREHQCHGEQRTPHDAPAPRRRESERTTPRPSASTAIAGSPSRSSTSTTSATSATRRLPSCCRSTWTTTSSDRVT